MSMALNEETGPFLECGDVERWQALAEEVKQRRAELGLSQEEARAIANVGNQLWSYLENGKLGPRIFLRVQRGIERALQWKSGSVQWVLLGAGEPTPLEDDPTPAFLKDENENLRERVSDLEQRVAGLEELAEDLEPVAQIVRDLRA